MSRPNDKTIIGTKGVITYKMDKNGLLTRIKAKLAGKGYKQEKGIDFETFAHVGRFEAIKM